MAERKAREAANTPEAKVAAFKAAVAEDAIKMLEEEKRKVEEAAEAQRKQIREAAIAELSEAASELRKAAEAGEVGMAMRQAKMRLGVATKAAASAGVSQESMVEATAPPKPPPEISAEEQLESELAAAAEAAEGEAPEGGAAEGAAAEGEGEADAEDTEDSKKKKKKKDKEKKPTEPPKSVIVQRAAHAAANEAKEAGKTAAEITKAAAAAAKENGADPPGIAKAAADGAKIARGETVRVIEYAEDDGGDDSSSSSGSSSSTEECDEAAISQNERDKAKRDGIAAVFYFGRGR